MIMKTDRVPLMKVQIQIPPGYPGEEPPKYQVKGFYSRYQDEIDSKLLERWSPGSMVLYDCYAYLLSDFLDELVLPLEKQPLSSL
jgi:E3 ubiquitin-protein ligase RNF14